MACTLESVVPAGHKLVRFFRLQEAPKCTPANFKRAMEGKPLRGKRRGRLVSYAIRDVYCVPCEWAMQDVLSFVRDNSHAYFAVFMDGTYHILPSEPVRDAFVNACIASDAMDILQEGTLRW